MNLIDLADIHAASRGVRLPFPSPLQDDVTPKLAKPTPNESRGPTILFGIWRPWVPRKQRKRSKP